MKIASQLLSPTPNVAVKTGSSSDGGMEFQSALTAAIAARSAGGSDTSQVKAKPLAQDTKPQTADSKKKSAVSDSSVSDVSVLLIPVLKQLPTGPPAQLAIPVTQNNEASVQTSDQTSSGLQLPSRVVGGDDRLSASLTSISPLALLPTSLVSIGRTDHKTLNGEPDLAPGSSQASLQPAGNGALAQVSKSNNSHPDLPAMPTIQAVATPAIAATGAVATVPAAQISESATPKPATADQITVAPKPADTGNSEAAVSAVDAAATAMQQAAAAAVQSLAAPVSLPSLSPVIDLQQTAANPTNSFSEGNKVSDTLKGAASRQTSPAAAAKAKSPASEVHGKLTDATDGETQAANTPTGTPSFAAKVPAAPGTVSQGASDSKGALEVLTLQQVTPPGQSDGSSHISRNTQSGSVSADPKVPTPAPQETQAMQGVSSAQLIQSMRSSEMKLGMQSAEFGNISISTSLNHQALSAQISFDHLELGKALAMHLPAIEEKLGSAYGLQAKVELRDSNSPPSSNDSGYSNSGQQSREQRQSQGGGTTASQGGVFERIASQASFTTVSPTASASRLDIRI